MIGADVRDSCGKSAFREKPAGESRGGSPTARGKRVPLRSNQRSNCTSHKIDKLDFHRVCLQSEEKHSLEYFLDRLRLLQKRLYIKPFVQGQ
ncbi:hypothetical protein RCO48_27185 [Peribacillus frigoritolerans]|nr:hypothetical protein [Peribacillus frigoritolerans]